MIIKSDAIFTGRPSLPKPGYVVVKDNRIVYVGNDLELFQQYKKENVRIVDAGKGLVMPGFHDAHLHFYMAGLYDTSLVKVSYTDESEAECVKGLEEIAEVIPKDRWLIGAGWDNAFWTNPTPPTKKSLDQAYPDRPVCMVSADAHSMWLNSVGLEKAGLHDGIEDPPGGFYGRFENGELDGTVHEMPAMELFPQVFSFSKETEQKFHRDYIAKLNRYGITSVCDVAMTASPGADFIREEIYEELLASGNLTVRVSIFPTLERDLSRPLKLMKRMQGDILRCQGVKQFADGVSPSHTAYLKEDYTNAKFPGDRGKMTIPEEEMRQMILNAHKNGISVRVHSIGDQAIHVLLDIFEEAVERYGYKENVQHTLEHLENFQPEDIERMAKLRVLPSVQPSHMMIDPEGVELDLGTERMRHMWPFRRLLDTGSILAFGTDNPDADLNPIPGIYNAVTRQSAENGEPKGGWIPEERISLEEALSAYTYGSACACRRQDEVGLLEPGKLADITILDMDPFDGELERILEASVLMTIMNGNIVFEKE